MTGFLLLGFLTFGMFLGECWMVESMEQTLGFASLSGMGHWERRVGFGMFASSVNSVRPWY